MSCWNALFKQLQLIIVVKLLQSCYLCNSHAIYIYAIVFVISDINVLLDLYFLKAQYDKSLLVNDSTLSVYYLYFHY